MSQFKIRLIYIRYFHFTNIKIYYILYKIIKDMQISPYKNIINNAYYTIKVIFFYCEVGNKSEQDTPILPFLMTAPC